MHFRVVTFQIPSTETLTSSLLAVGYTREQIKLFCPYWLNHYAHNAELFYVSQYQARARLLREECERVYGTPAEGNIEDTREWAEYKEASGLSAYDDTLSGKLHELDGATWPAVG
jgi:hypothetical protein